MIYQRDQDRVKGVENVWLQDSFHLFWKLLFCFYAAWRPYYLWSLKSYQRIFFLLSLHQCWELRANQEKWNYLFWIFWQINHKMLLCLFWQKHLVMHANKVCYNELLAKRRQQNLILRLMSAWAYGAKWVFFTAQLVMRTNLKWASSKLQQTK